RLSSLTFRLATLVGTTFLSESPRGSHKIICLRLTFPMWSILTSMSGSGSERLLSLGAIVPRSCGVSMGVSNEYSSGGIAAVTDTTANLIARLRELDRLRDRV